MSFYETEGDLFDPALRLKAIGHGVNCRGMMGAGIAKVFRSKYPGMYAAYELLCERGNLPLGGIMIWKEQNVTVYNLATQFNPGANAKLEHVKSSVWLAMGNCRENGIASLGLPRIGCGIGGLDWLDVREIMEEAAGEFPEVHLVAVTLPPPPVKVCIGCESEQGQPHKTWCPVMTGTLNTLPGTA